MARNHFAACLIAAFALGACGKDNSAADAAANKRLAAARARGDSTRKARGVQAAADSIARVRYVACTDSVTAVLAKAPARTRTKVTPAASAAMIESACGQPQTTTLASGTPPAPVARDTAKSAAALTPQQQQLARADSMHRATDVMRAAATRLAGEQARADSTRVATADSAANDSLAKARETEVQRETFAYAGGARDPFSSLMNAKNDGPELVDLQLVGVYEDLRYSSNSVAVLREKTSGKRHKVRVGDQIGRLRVSQIRARDVVFQVNDFGFERQETLSLRKQEDVTP